MTEGKKYLAIPHSYRNSLLLQTPSPPLSEGDILELPDGPPPLLGSPYTCDVWGPLPHKNSPSLSRAASRCSSIPQYTPPSPGRALMWTPDDELRGGDLQTVLLRMLSVMKQLQCRLDSLLVDARRMRTQVWAISHTLEKLVADMDRALRQATGARLDLADNLYLEQLICLLNGDLRHLPLHNWPFRLTHHPLDGDLNLVI